MPHPTKSVKVSLYSQAFCATLPDRASALWGMKSFKKQQVLEDSRAGKKNKLRKLLGLGAYFPLVEIFQEPLTLLYNSLERGVVVYDISFII
jgi:hypothetical protein